MEDKKFKTHPNLYDRFEGLITYGDRDIELPENCLISITLGERFSVWKTIVNAVVSQFVMRQMKKSPGLVYAELKGNIREGYGFTMTVWESKAMVAFRDRGAHNFAMRFFSWVFYGGKSQAYFLTYKTNGVIPTSDEAYRLVKEYGKFLDGGKLIRKPRRPYQKDEKIINP